MSTGYVNLPPVGSPSWKAAVANQAALPASGNSTGDARVAKDTGAIYVWTGAAWVAASGSSSNSFATIQPDFGTAPVASSPTDTLTITSSDGTISVIGSSGAKSINLQAADLSLNTIMKDDFLGGGPPADLTINHSGTGSKSSIRSAASTNTNPGVWSLQTGTDTNGNANLFGSDVDQVFSPVGAGSFFFEALVRLSALSDGTNTYTATLGMCEDPYNANPSPANGIFFSYTHSVTSGRWVLYCKSASANTSADTATTVVAATWYRLGFVINAAGTSVQAYVNGVAAGSPITTNIPSSNLMLGFVMSKSAGTTSRILDIDYYKMVKNLTTPR